MKLEIAIPVFKRPDLFRELLNTISLVESDRIAVSVYDDTDCSYTENETVCSDFEKKLNIIYKRNLINLGIDANIAQCFSKASHNWVLVVGEDDLLNPEGLTDLLDQLSGTRSDVVICRYNYFKNGKILQGLNPTQNFGSWQDFCNCYFDKLGFIGSFCIRADKPSDRNYLELNSFFGHLGMLLELLKVNQEPEFSHDVVVYNRVGGLDAFSWKSDALIVQQGMSTLLDYVSVNGLTELDLKPISTLVDNAFNPYKPKRALRLKAEGVLGSSTILREAFKRKSIGLLIIVMVPYPMCYLILKCYQAYKWNWAHENS